MTALPGRRPFPGRAIAGGGLALLVLLGLAMVIRSLNGTPTGTIVPVPLATVAPVLEARGLVVPQQFARLSPVVGSRVNQILVAEGDRVTQGQELMRFELGQDVVSLFAPFPGTITSVVARKGETLLPGATAITIADLTHYLVETTDVDEYTIARIKDGELATLRIDALSDTTFKGRVARVALMALTGEAGDRNFPVKIDIDSTDPRIRWGMSARITFGE